MNKHTSEPWISEDTGGIYGGPQYELTVYEPHNHEFSQADRERIVACVNRLASIPTEKLESEHFTTSLLPLDVRLLLAEQQLAKCVELNVKQANTIGELMQQREELLDAIKPFVAAAAEIEKINGHAKRDDECPVWGVEKVTLRLGHFRAIAKAGG